MTTTLSEGVKVPDVGSTDWADDLETNWNLLNTALAQQGSWAKVDEAQTFTGVQTFSDGIVGSLQGTANMAMSDADGNTITSTYATKTELSTLSTTVGTKANDADVVHKADAETITGAKTFSATVTSADVVPSATDTYSLGSASYQYNAVYGKSYFYNGTQWGLDKNNIWTAIQTFTARPIFAQDANATELTLQNLSFDPATSGQASVSANSNTTFMARNATHGEIGGLRFFGKSSGTTARINVRYYTEASTSSEEGVQLGYDGSTCTFSPGTTGTIDLGTSTNKWKTLNGINPGALSLPDYDKVIAIDTTNWSVPGSNNYTPTQDGWLCVITKDTATSSIFVYPSNIALAKQYCASVYGNGSQGNGRLSIMLPVRANVQYTVILRGDSASDIYSVRFYPCLGNV